MSTTAQGASPFYTAEHAAFRDLMRRFVAKEITPFVNEWDDAGSFPRELYNKAAEVGLLGLGFPEAYGGNDGDLFMTIIASQELARCGAGGVLASLLSHTIGCPPIVNVGSEALKQRVLPPVLRGEKISALGITEPSGGSDVANLKTTARREGDHYIVNGSKTFITSGIRADFYTVAVRTGGPGPGGVSLLLIEKGTPGFTQTPLRKMGWLCSDTATLYFDNCRVPVANLVGQENQGFKAIMKNFNRERIFLAAGTNGFARVCLDEALGWAKQREMFDGKLIDMQVTRHKLADMAMRIEATQAMLELLAWRVEQGEQPVGEICLLKNQATQTMAFCASEAVQIHGGAGFIRGVTVERIYREVKVNAIGGGAEEVMRDLASRQLGFYA
ncbi:MAG: acyl-CoA dehydrogenase family protein [Burkholderiales bacterium]|jgi:acyl-CoA dehydrogenase|nr:acyl-CoA dehydrogenase family protein [Burkholderiales bacterium]OJX34244.1 MAG: acyl-CoA dehydrogenase [Burkholderiales bacterium 68-12]